MTKNINDVIAGFSPEDQKDIQAVTQNIIEEYDSLKSIREHIGLTQTEVAQNMSLNQSNISDMEKRTDMKVSSLKSYLEAIGCEIDILVTRPDKSVINIDEIFNH
jgi:predicted transcriptional regulator